MKSLVRRSVLVVLMGAAACMTPGGEAGGDDPPAKGGQMATGGTPAGGSVGSGGSSPGGSGGASGPSAGGAGGSAPAATGGAPAEPGPAAGGSGGGGTGVGGSGGSTGSDAASSPSDSSGGAPTPIDSPPGAPDPESAFTCTHLIGINATAEWYGAGFETMVDNAKWQMVRVHSGFVDLWANPTAAAWNTGATSACATNSKTPDRVIFIGLRFEWTSKQQWVDALTAVVKNLKAKFPGLKRIELGTFVRGPGNKPCGSRPAYRSTIHPSQDEAIAEVVATDTKLLRASPKFEVTACSDFTGNPPHFAGGGARNVAKVVGDYYTGKAK